MNTNNALHYYREALNASHADRLKLLVPFFNAAISERERGEMELYEVGNKVIVLLGKMDAEMSDSLGDLFGVASELDMAGQGGTSAAADEILWDKFKRLVSEYEASI
jgi:hypothetical protein